MSKNVLSVGPHRPRVNRRNSSILLLVLAGCGGALSATEVQHRRDDATARTAAALQHSRDAYVAAHHLHLAPEEGLDAYPRPYAPNAPGQPRVVVGSGAGLAFGEAIVEVATKDGARLAFAYPSRCGCSGCDTSLQYAVASAEDGSAVVLRLHAVDHVSHVRQAGACPYGCGMPMPPEPPVALALPTADAARVHVVDVPFDRYVVEAKCDREVAVP